MAMIFIAIEITGGIMANSIAIMSDAAHMASDVVGDLSSVISVHIATRAATKRFSYGYHRIEIVGALISIVSIWVMVFFLLYEAT